jgi:hypothetical protein
MSIILKRECCQRHSVCIQPSEGVFGESEMFEHESIGHLLPEHVDAQGSQQQQGGNSKRTFFTFLRLFRLHFLDFGDEGWRVDFGQRIRGVNIRSLRFLWRFLLAEKICSQKSFHFFYFFNLYFYLFYYLC